MAGLSDALIKDFVTVTNDSSEKQVSDGITVYGTVTRNGDKVYVKIDGSELLTPVSEAMDSKDKDRVMVLVKDHVATVVGNVTAPATNDTEALEKVNADIDKANEDIANVGEQVKKVDVRVDEANGRITSEIERANGVEGELHSMITQTADSIVAEVNRANAVEGELSSRIQQTVESIVAEVNRANEVEGNLNSRIEQTAEAITHRVSYTDFNGDTIASLINQTATKISMNAATFEFISNKCKIVDGALSVASLSFYDASTSKFLEAMEYDSERGCMVMKGSFGIAGDLFILNSGQIRTDQYVTKKQLTDVEDDIYTFIKNHLANQVGSATWNTIASNSWIVTSCGLSNSNGTVSIYGNHMKYSLSDRRLKEDVVDLDDRYIDLYKRLNPVVYAFHDDIPTTPGRHYGFIAQDVKKAVDESGVYEDKLRLVWPSEVDEEAHEDRYIDDVTWNLDYNELHALHVKYSHYLEKRISEQHEIIKALTERVEKLEETINHYKIGGNQNG